MRGLSLNHLATTSSVQNFLPDSHTFEKTLHMNIRTQAQPYDDGYLVFAQCVSLENVRSCTFSITRVIVHA